MITKFLNRIHSLKEKEINLKYKIDIYSKLYLSVPCLAIILVGNDFSSNLYVRNKILLCNKININVFLFKLSKNIKIETLKILINIMNNDFDINGILIQKPIPINLDKLSLFKAIIYEKDVDIMNPINFLRYIGGYSNIVIPCISNSIYFLLENLNINFNKIKVGIFGFSNLIGKPLCYSLASKGSKVCIINLNDNNPVILSKSCDIIIIAIGFPLFLSKKFVSYGSIIIDIGINKSINNTVVGDANLNDLLGYVSWITPVPGGVGPVNVFFLLSNLIKLYLYQKYNLKKIN